MKLGQNLPASTKAVKVDLVNNSSAPVGPSKCWWADENYPTPPGSSPAIPPLSNTGGKCLSGHDDVDIRNDVTRFSNGFAAIHLDWVGYTVWIDDAHLSPPTPRLFGAVSVPVPFDVCHAMHDLETVHGEKLFFVVTGLGWNGYEFSAQIQGTDHQRLGIMAWGGNHGSIHVELTGAGCVGLDNRKLHKLLTKRDARLTRCDIAADIQGSGRHWGQWMIEQHAAGNCTSGGRPPKLRDIWNSDDEGVRHLETVYVGSRQGGKLIRAYDKGVETGAMDRGEWFRIEGEYRAVNKRALPLEMLLEPAQYLSGMLPCLEFLSAFPVVVKCNKREVEGSVALVLKWLLAQVGPSVSWLLDMEVTPDELCAAIRREYRLSGRKAEFKRQATPDDVRRVFCPA